MINRIALEGIDGSGKTSVAEALATSLGDEGLNAGIYMPYRLAAQQLGEDIYPLWSTESGAKAAISTLKAALVNCEADAKDKQLDVVIYDRHWMTAFTEIGSNSELLEDWGDTFVPAALLRVAPGMAARRLHNDMNARWSTLEAQQRYAIAFGITAHRYPRRMLGVYRSEDDVSIEALARNIRWDMNIRR